MLRDGYVKLRLGEGDTAEDDGAALMHRAEREALMFRERVSPEVLHAYVLIYGCDLPGPKKPNWAEKLAIELCVCGVDSRDNW